MAEDEMVGWHHRLNGHEPKQALGGGEGQGSLACCSPWGRRESDMTERLNSSIVGQTLFSYHGREEDRQGDYISGLTFYLG